MITGNRQFAVIVLAGGCHFAQCPILARRPAALWPIAGEPALKRLNDRLLKQGVAERIVCLDSSGNLQSDNMASTVLCGQNVKFVNEELPVGTAGSLRDAARCCESETLIVLSAGTVSLPNLGQLVSAHRSNDAEFTVVFNPSDEPKLQGRAANIYICNRSVLKLIPEDGYYDIKESMIPGLLRAEQKIGSMTLGHDVGNFRNRAEYLCAVGCWLEQGAAEDLGSFACERSESAVVWKGSDVQINGRARIFGKVLLLDGCVVGEDAVIFGPSVIGRASTVGGGSVVVNSVLWDNSRIGRDCEIVRSVVDYGAVVGDKHVVSETSDVSRSAASSHQPKAQSAAVKHRVSIERPAGGSGIASAVKFAQRHRVLALAAAAVVVFAFAWSYWPGLTDLWRIWQRSDEYSSGLLVPFVAAYVIWARRKELKRVSIQPCWWGVPALLGAQAGRFFGLYYMYGSAERLSIILSIAAISLLLFGWRLLVRLWAVMLFLVLMVPWPNRVQDAVSLPLQSWATSSAVFCLETLGYEVSREGNIIHIGDTAVAVAEACNGLRMVMAFFVVSGLVVLLVNRSRLEKLLILASSVPIALLCNTLRLAITAVAFTKLHGARWESIFHDFGGYAMMPLALMLVVGEFWLLKRLVVQSAMPAESGAAGDGGAPRSV